MKKTLHLLTAAIACCLVSCQAPEMDEVIVISTPYGEMKAILFDDTPLHKANFLELTKAGKYDSVLFHRVIENFMIQTGDLSTGQQEKDADYRIDAEFLPEKYFHKKGALAAARMGDAQNPMKQSSGSQFYIVQGEVYDLDGLEVRRVRRDFLRLNGFFERMRKMDKYVELNEKYNYHVNLAQEDSTYDFAAAQQGLVFASRELIEKEFGPQTDPGFSEEQVEIYTTIGGTPHLDGEYTIFGQVVEGLEVVDKIAAVETNQRDRPLEEVRMKVSVVEMPKSEITKKYGIEYPKKADQ
ncbi:MAG: peptidylprolyl isomerase [Cytophagales bacterium CG12_big_fil_rev_8_21_14_0_65_40_12]|nr:MAG: peptidylprolyl isomerase [Cytophagales bacterium CG12_big_fil_rev_8_21_14_0_65_40_12]PIW04351.1 MAG: peptidylprolyl isomerase [Cytophagales bacterium CG17_big_fil_post_rev_8_21_14_2_50_40_13]